MKSKLLIALAICLFAASRGFSAVEIQVGDIGKKVVIVGRLEVPVGTVVEGIEGQLMTLPRQLKSGQIVGTIRVSKVNGKALSQPSILALHFRTSGGVPPLQKNQLVKISGYESVTYIGTPAGAREDLGSDASSLDWKLESTIYVIKYEGK
jgi:hypothetical protein